MESLVKLTHKPLDYLLLFLLVLSLIPFILISAFIHPSYDDYLLINELDKVGLANFVPHWYQIWSGRFFSFFILGFLSSLYRHDFLVIYRFFPIILMGIFFLCYYMLGRNMAGNKGSRKSLLLFALFGLVLYLQKMPQVTGGFYYMVHAWMTSIGTILFVFQLSAIWRIIDSRDFKSRLIWTIIASLVGIGVGSAYETIMMVSLIILCILWLGLFYKNDQSKNWLLIVIGVTLIAALISVLAPGNVTRGGEEMMQKDMGFLITLSVKMVVYSIRFLIESVQNLMLLAGTILFIPLAMKWIDQNQTLKNYLPVNPLILFGASLFVFIVAFFPTFWALNRIPPPRALNQLYFFFIGAWMLNVLNLVMYYRVSISGKELMVVAKVMVVIALMPSVHNKNISRAWSDLLTKASAYDLEMEARYDLMENANDEITLPVLFESPAEYPLTIYYNYQELNDYYQGEANVFFAEYWGVDSVRLESEEVTLFLTNSRTF